MLVLMRDGAVHFLTWSLHLLGPPPCRASWTEDGQLCSSHSISLSSGCTSPSPPRLSLLGPVQFQLRLLFLLILLILFDSSPSLLFRPPYTETHHSQTDARNHTHTHTCAQPRRSSDDAHFLFLRLPQQILESTPQFKALKSIQEAMASQPAPVTALAGLVFPDLLQPFIMVLQGTTVHPSTCLLYAVTDFHM
jgi:hypothetical protein